jgi:hypothetical protein
LLRPGKISLWVCEPVVVVIVEVLFEMDGFFGWGNVL